MKKKKQSKKKDFLDVMYETEKKFKKLLTDIYKIHNSGWVQKREIHYLIEDIKDIKENLITAEVIKYGRQWHFKELKENLWKWVSCKNATVAKMQHDHFGSIKYFPGYKGEIKWRYLDWPKDNTKS